MANYISQTVSSAGVGSGDLTNAIGNSTLAVLAPNGTGVISGTIVSSAVLDAEAEVNSLLGPGFAVPIATASAQRIVKRCAVDICSYLLYDRRPEFYTADGRNPAKERYDRATRILREIKSGARDMGGESGTHKSAATTMTVYSSAQHFITESAETSSGGTTGGF